jgi:hypothetical protein
VRARSGQRLVTRGRDTGWPVWIPTHVSGGAPWVSQALYQSRTRWPASRRCGSRRNQNRLQQVYQFARHPAALRSHSASWSGTGPSRRAKRMVTRTASSTKDWTSPLQILGRDSSLNSPDYVPPLVVLAFPDDISAGGKCCVARVQPDAHVIGASRLTRQGSKTALQTSLVPDAPA